MSDYTNSVPMAQYNDDSIVHLSHPAKNHAADICTNPFIPSTSLKLLMSSQPDQDLFDISLELIGGDHVDGTIDHLGYQRCFKFCEDKDKSHCITSWKIPKIQISGRYTFNWVWQFNTGEYYSTCFDAMISTDGNSNPTPMVTQFINVSQSGSNLDNQTITLAPISSTPSPITPSPTPSTPSPSPTPSTPSPSSSSVSPSPTFQITSDANQLKSIFFEIFNSIRVQFNGTLNISTIFD
jgi:cell division septation protein DedD